MTAFALFASFPYSLSSSFDAMIMVRYIRESKNMSHNRKQNIAEGDSKTQAK